MYQYICTIDYDNLKTIFNDYTSEELEALYDKYNGVTLLQKTKEELSDFDIQEFLIFQNQLRTIYEKDTKIFSDENIKKEVLSIIENNINEKGKAVC